MKTTFLLSVLFILVIVGGYLWNAHVQSVVQGGVPYTELHTTATSSSAFSLAQISTHTTADDCWSAINGSVYNLSSWVSKHPGGEANIVSICGKDGTEAFGGRHAMDARALAVLARYKIGTLTP